MAELKVYKTNNKNFPWRAEDSEGRFIDARTKVAAINMYNALYNLTKCKQNVEISDEMKVKMGENA